MRSKINKSAESVVMNILEDVHAARAFSTGAVAKHSADTVEAHMMASVARCFFTEMPIESNGGRIYKRGKRYARCNDGSM